MELAKSYKSICESQIVLLILCHKIKMDMGKTIFLRKLLIKDSLASTSCRGRVLGINRLLRKRLMSFLIGICGIVSTASAQTLIKPENDSTFITEFRDDNEFGIIARDSVIVGVSCNSVKDNYGSYYQLNILIQNLTDTSFVFDSADVKASLVTKWDENEEMKVYTAQSLQKKIRTAQMWTAIAIGLNAGLNPASAGYQTSYVSSPYGGYTVQTNNAGNAALANMLATNQILLMGKQMENDRKVRDEGYLKKNTVKSGEGIYGYMMIKRQKGKEMAVVLPVNGRDYTFTWSLAKKMKN